MPTLSGVPLVTQVLGRTVQTLDTYRQGQIFSGTDVSPASKATDDDAVAFVNANPGAIGYVSGSAGTAGVKVVVIQ